MLEVAVVVKIDDKALDPELTSTTVYKLKTPSSLEQGSCRNVMSKDHFAEDPRRRIIVRKTLHSVIEHVFLIGYV